MQIRFSLNLDLSYYNIYVNLSNKKQQISRFSIFYVLLKILKLSLFLEVLLWYNIVYFDIISKIFYHSFGKIIRKRFIKYLRETYY